MAGGCKETTGEDALILEMTLLGGALYVGGKLYEKRGSKPSILQVLEGERRSPSRRRGLPLSGSYTENHLLPGHLIDEVKTAWHEAKVGMLAVRDVTSMRAVSIIEFTHYAIRAWTPYWRSVVIIVPSLLAFKLYQTAFAASLQTIVNGMIGVTSGTTVVWVLGGLAIGFPIVAVTYLLGQRLVSLVASDILNDIRRDMFDHLQLLSIRFYKDNTTGNVISRFSSDINQIEKGLTRKAMDGLIAVIAIGVNVSLLFVLNWQLGLITAIALPTTVLMLRDLVPWAKNSIYRLQKEKAKVVNLVQENFTMQSVIKGYGYQQPMEKIFQSHLADLRVTNVESLFSNALVESTSILSLLFSQLLITGAGG